MNTATAEKAPTTNLSRVPPEEQFWKRYSPHGEAPLSMAGSITLHILALGALFLASIYLASLFFPTTESLPVESVRLALGGGGGKKSGVGDAKGVGTGPEDVGQQSEKDPLTGIDDVPPRPALNQAEVARITEKYDAASQRIIQSDTEPAKAFARLNDNIRRKLADGLNPGKGQEGIGSGGGSGTGSGKGNGSSSGAGKATLNQREKRMLRWHMKFTANSGPEYLAQLRGLGAILAFPVTEGADPTYKVVRNLRPGQARLEEEDLSKIHRIYWIDDKPRSVEDILAALGLRLQMIPSRFVAFMPDKLEAHLYQMERAYVKNILRRPFKEDMIEETVFKAVHTPTGYKAELIQVKMK